MVNKAINNLVSIKVNYLTKGSIIVDSTLTFQNIIDDTVLFQDIVKNAIISNKNDSNIPFELDSINLLLGR